MRHGKNKTGQYKSSSDIEYHRREVEIAKNVHDVRRIIPELPGGTQRVLEVGCGAGAVLGSYEMGCAPFRCGVDVDHSVLRLGRKLVEDAYFIQARGESLPFRSMEFDFVIARVSLPYMNIPESLCEIVRVLKPGGRIWAALHSFSMVQQELLDSIRKMRVKDSIFRVYVMLNGLSMHLTGTIFPFRSGRYESFQTEHSIASALLAAGLTDIKILRSQFFVVHGRKP